MEELETKDASEIYSKRLNAKEVIFPKENGKFMFPIADGQTKTFGGDQELRTSTLIRHRPIQGESNINFSWRIRGVSSTTWRFISGCRWSDKRLLVHVGKLRMPPSRWTKSQTLLAERRIIPYSTEVHWRWLVEYRWVKRFVWLLDNFHSVHSIGEESPNGFLWSGKRLTKRQVQSRPDHLWPELWVKLGRVLSWRRSKNGQMKNRNSIMPEDYEEFISLTLRTRKSSKMQEEDGKHKWLPLCIARLAGKTSMGRPVARVMISSLKFECILEASESTRLRVEESRQFTTTLQFGTQIYSYASKQWRCPQQKQQWMKNVRNWKRFRRGIWEKSEVRKRWSMKQGRRAQKFFLPH